MSASISTTKKKKCSQPISQSGVRQTNTPVTANAAAPRPSQSSGDRIRQLAYKTTVQTFNSFPHVAGPARYPSLACLLWAVSANIGRGVRQMKMCLANVLCSLPCCKRTASSFVLSPVDLDFQSCYYISWHLCVSGVCVRKCACAKRQEYVLNVRKRNRIVCWLQGTSNSRNHYWTQNGKGR